MRDRLLGRARVAARWGKTILRSPDEALDRFRTRRLGMEPITGHADGVEDAWRDLAVASGEDPDQVLDGFDAMWDQMWQLARPFDGRSSHHDGDVAFARCLWVAVRACKPRQVIETGVARGVSTAVILEAMKRNGGGTLTSIDLPPLSDPWYSSSAELVPDDLTHSWTLIRGDVRRVLPQVLVDIQQLDMFVHDSLHTYAHMTFEFGLASRFLRPEGVLMSDDVHYNAAWADLTASGMFKHSLRGRHATQGGAFGVAWDRNELT